MVGTLGTALTTLVDALNANQSSLSHISNNIANANTVGYTKRIVSQESKVVNGVVTGVGVIEIRRAVDEYVNNTALGQATNVGYAKIKNDYYNRLHNTILGAPNSAGTVGKSLSDFYTALDSYSNDPSSAVKRTLSVNTANSLAQNISSLAGQIQQQRLTADSNIATKVGELNNLMKDLTDLNVSLQQTKSAGGDLNDIHDIRDQKLLSLKKIIGASISYNEIGQVSVYVNNVQIVSPNSKYVINYDKVSSVHSLINNGTISGITVSGFDANGTPTAATEVLLSGSDAKVKVDNLPTGELRALVEIRDVEYPNILAQLDNLAYNIVEEFNAVHNMGSGYPPATSYIGQELMTLTDRYNFSGSFRIGVVDAGGNPVRNTYGDILQPLEIDFSKFDTGAGPGVASLADILNEINRYYDGTSSASVNLGPLKDIKLGVTSNNVNSVKATGALTFAANPASGTNIVINGVTFNITDTPAGLLDIQRGSTLAATMNNVANTLNASQNPAVSDATYRSLNNNSIEIVHDFGGTVGNAFTISAGTSGGVASGANLSGGVNASGVLNFDFDLLGLDAQGGNMLFEVEGLSVNGSPAAYSFDPYTLTAGSNQRTSQGAGNGTLSAAIPPGLSEGDTFDISVSVKVTDSNGNVSNETITYTVTIPDPADNIVNTRIDATAISGSGEGVLSPATFTNSIITASMVDAKGNPITDPNQAGYLQLQSNGSIYRIVIDDINSSMNGIYNSANPAASATGRGFGQMFGINNLFNSLPDVKNAALNMSVRSDIISNPALLSSARLTKSANTGVGVTYGYEIGSSSNAIAQAMVALQNKNINFAYAGTLPAMSTTFESFSTEFYNFATVQANSAESEYNKHDALFSTITKHIDDIGGVNIDEEIANTVSIQNNYSAAARLLSIVRDLFRELTEVM
jgi:flagellar hook-associated protein FlgK